MRTVAVVSVGENDYGHPVPGDAAKRSRGPAPRSGGPTSTGRSRSRSRAVARSRRANADGAPADLAASLGRERLSFKADVRKLKALGLTESLEVGYRLSPRGRAFLERSP